MNNSRIMRAVMSSLPPTDWPGVLMALRHDAIIWNSLQDGDLVQRFQPESGSRLQDWSPASLALASLDPSSSLNDLTAQPAQPLEPGLRLQALRAYEACPFHRAEMPACEQIVQGEAVVENLAPLTLQQAGLLALALREKLRQTEDVPVLLEELRTSPAGTLEMWQTPFAILFGFLTEPVRLVAALLHPLSTPAEWSLGLHALLSNPLTVEKQLDLLQEVVLSASFSPLQLIQIIRLIARTHHDLSSQFANWLLTQSVLEPTPAEQDNFASCQQAILLAEASLVAGDSAQALANIERARLLNQMVQAEIETAWGYLTSQHAKKDEDATESTRKVTEVLKKSVTTLAAQPETSDILGETESFLSEILLQSGDTDETRRWLEQLTENEPAEDETEAAPKSPALYLQAARVAQQAGESTICSRLLTRALAALEGSAQPLVPHSIKQRLQPATKQFYQNVAELTQLALECGEKSLAKQSARLAVSKEYIDPELMVLCGEALYDPRAPEEACQAFEFAVGLQPDNLEARRWLAHSTESRKDWPAALPHRSFIVTHLQETGQLNTDDLHALGVCAHQAGEYPVAIKAGLQALDIDPENVAAQLLLADTYRQTGDIAASMEHYRSVCHSSPENEAAWMGLAKLQMNQNQTKNALDTLRAAAQSIPDSAEIQLELGKVLLSEQSLTPALAALEKAYELCHITGCGEAHSAYESAALLYGQTLLQLGQSDRACEVLEEAYSNPDFSPLLLAQVAHRYAQSLLAIGKPEQAVLPLESALKTIDDQPDLHLDYARTLLTIGQKPVRAVMALNRVLQASPDSLEAQGWMAVGLEAMGEIQSAFQEYQKTLETKLANQKEWRARLSAGLGRTALALGKRELGLAAVQEAAQAYPERPDYQRQLAEAFWAVKLPFNALQTARAALQLDRDNVDNLAWFADQVLRSLTQHKGSTPSASSPGTGEANDLSGTAEGINVLRHALELEPDRADLYTRLARLQILGKEPAAASESLRSILSLENLSIPFLQESAILAEEAGNPRLATDFYKRAVQLVKETDPASYLELLLKLAQVQANSQNYHAALQTLRQVIALNPSDARPYLVQAEIFQALEQPESVVNCLEAALPNLGQPAEQINIYTRLANVLNEQRRIPEAYYYALQGAELAGLDPKTGPNTYPGIYLLAAELAYSLIMPEPMRKYLSMLSFCDASSALASDPGLQSRYYCLSLETALDANELSLAAAHLDACQRGASESLRLLAGQARLLLRQSELSRAQSAFQEVLKKLPHEKAVPQDSGQSAGSDRNLSCEDWLALSSAALEMGYWDKALSLAHQAQRSNPASPAAALQLVRVISQSAEFQHLCLDLEVLAHMPGFDALAAEAQSDFQQSLHTAEKLLRSARQILEDKGLAFSSAGDLLRWKSRGSLAYLPIVETNPEPAEDLSAEEKVSYPLIAPWVETAEDAAAWLAYLRRTARQNPTLLIHLSASVAEILTQFPRQSSVALQAGLANAAQNPQEALRILQQTGAKAEASYPFGLLIQALQARLHLQVNQPDQAEPELNEALAIWPEESRWHSQAAQIDQIMATQDPSRINASFHHIEEAIRLEPKHLPHYLSMGSLVLEAQSQEPAQVSKATRLLERAARIHPKDAAVWLQLAQLYYRSGQPDSQAQAARCADQAIQVMGIEKDIRAHLLRAEIALQQNQPEYALKCIEAAQALNPASSEVLLAQVRALDALDQPTSALQVLDKVIPQTDNPLPLVLHRAELLAHSGELESAQRLLRQLAAQYPTQPEIFVRLAYTLSQAGDIPGAIQAAHTALQVNNPPTETHAEAAGMLPNTPLSVQTQAEMHQLLGTLNGREGHLDNAIHHLDQAIDLNPTAVDSYLELGQVYQKQRQYHKALQTFQQAMAAAPDDFRPFYQSGLALKDSKDYLGSEEMLRRAADLAPDNVAVRRQLAAIVALNLVHNPHAVAIK